MCEGPEVFALANALACADVSAFSYGTHLFVEQSQEDWRFLSNGCNVVLNEDGSLENSRWHGVTRSPASSPADLISHNNLGIDWMQASPMEILYVVEKWSKSRKPLGARIASQFDMAGLGVAWGSEVCHQAHVVPPEPSNEQDLGNVAEALISARNTLENFYSDMVTPENAREFISEWPLNVFNSRTMLVYEQGDPVAVNGYTWWV